MKFLLAIIFIIPSAFAASYDCGELQVHATRTDKVIISFEGKVYTGTPTHGHTYSLTPGEGTLNVFKEMLPCKYRVCPGNAYNGKWKAELDVEGQLHEFDCKSL